MSAVRHPATSELPTANAGAAGSVPGISRGLPDIGRRRAITAAEDTVKIGQVAETAGKSGRADGLRGMARIIEYFVHAIQSAAQNEISERCFFRGKQHMDVARRDAVPVCDLPDREFVARKVFHDIGLDRAQPRSADAAAARERNQIAEVSSDETAYIGPGKSIVDSNYSAASSSSTHSPY